MIRIEIRHFTGTQAKNVKVAARLQRKIFGAIQSGHTVLIDFEDVTEVNADFAAALLPRIDRDKIKVAGLTSSQKNKLGYPEAEQEG